MKLHVQYMAQLRAEVGRIQEEVDLPAESCLLELLVHLAAVHTAAASHLVNDGGQARPSLLVVVNGSAVPAREAATIALHPGDVVSLLPPIAGG